MSSGSLISLRSRLVKARVRITSPLPRASSSLFHSQRGLVRGTWDVWAEAADGTMKTIKRRTTVFSAWGRREVQVKLCVDCVVKTAWQGRYTANAMRFSIAILLVSAAFAAPQSDTKRTTPAGATYT